MPPKPTTAKLNGPYSGTVGQALTVDPTASTAQPGSTLKNGSIGWGDGDVTNWTGKPAVESHVYQKAGSFTVVLTVWDTKGRTSTATSTADITATPPIPTPEPPIPTPIPPIPSPGTGPLFIVTPARRAAWAQMKADYDANPAFPATLGGTWYGFLQTQAAAGVYNDTGLMATQLYQMTGDAAWAAKAWLRVQDFLGMPLDTTKGNYVREYGQEHVIQHDWLAHGLTQAQRDQYQAAIAAMLNYALTGNIYAQGYPLGDSDQLIGDYFGVVLGHLRFPADPVITALFNRPDTGGIAQPPLTAAATTAREAIRYFVERMAEGGEWIESSEYNLGTVRLLLMGYEAVKTATGIDYFPEITAWLPTLANRLLAYWTPDLLQTYQWGDEEHPRGDDRYNWTNTIGLLQGLLDGTTLGGRLQDLLFDLVDQYGALGATSMAPYVTTRLFYTWNPYATRGDRTAQPKSFCAVGMGELLQRSGYGPSDSMAAINLNGRPDGRAVDHFVRWLGDFELYRQGEWAITHPRAYAGPPNMGLGVNSVVMHGFSDMPEYKKLVARAAADGYAYGAVTTGGGAVFQPYYDPPKVFCHEWTRSLLYLPGVTDSVILFDRAYVVSPVPSRDRYYSQDLALIDGAPAPKQWVLHMKTSPTIVGSTITWVTPKGQPVAWQTLLPAAQTKTVYDETSLAASDEFWGRAIIPSELGQHVRVSPATVQDFDTFLNTVQVGVAGVATLVEQAGEVQGVHLTRPTQDDALAVFNAKAAAPLVDVAYDPSHAAALDRAHLRATGYQVTWTATAQTLVFLLDLDPAKTWTRSVDGSAAVALTLDNGMATFAVPSAGLHRLTVSAA